MLNKQITAVIVLAFFIGVFSALFVVTALLPMSVRINNVATIKAAARLPNAKNLQH